MTIPPVSQFRLLPAFALGPGAALVPPPAGVTIEPITEFRADVWKASGLMAPKEALNKSDEVFDPQIAQIFTEESQFGENEICVHLRNLRMNQYLPKKEKTKANEPG